MSTTEHPLQRISRETPPDHLLSEHGSEPFTTYFEIRAVFPLPPTAIVNSEELSEHELIRAAADGGTFKFLENPEEDIYSVE